MRDELGVLQYYSVNDSQGARTPVSHLFTGVLIFAYPSSIVYGCVLHLDIKGEKIWIHHDGTEIGIADELVKLGVPKSDIVLAFHELLMRQYTGFAVG
ncbi:XisI protein [Scytonema hofmannii]|uniref:XisI protein n=1 Tax=Scytonema hofmannii TaxID=34078 RepID=UPI003AF321CB